MYADVGRDRQILPFFPALLENQKLSVVLIMLKYVQFCCGMVVGGFVGRNNATKCDYSVDFMEKNPSLLHCYILMLFSFWCHFRASTYNEFIHWSQVACGPYSSRNNWPNREMLQWLYWDRWTSPLQRRKQTDLPSDHIYVAGSAISDEKISTESFFKTQRSRLWHGIMGPRDVIKSSLP